MSKKIGKAALTMAVIFSLVDCTSLVNAPKGNNQAFSTKGNKGHHFSLPADAQDLGNGVYKLKGKNGIEGYSIFHYANASKPKTSGKPAPIPNLTCYGFIAAGVKWKNVEDYRVDAAGSGGTSGVDLDQATVQAIVAANIGKWETAASYNILGNDITSGPIGAVDLSVSDGNNDVVFGAIDGPGNTIAVTNVWGYFSGNPQTKRLIEWDQIFDNGDNFVWGTDGSATKMDFENISTHELGHATGLGDIYTAGCEQVTMFGYASVGDFSKSSLQADYTTTTAPITHIIGDITGINVMY
jgi:hypothetical protein